MIVVRLAGSSKFLKKCGGKCRSEIASCRPRASPRRLLDGLSIGCAPAGPPTERAGKEIHLRAKVVGVLIGVGCGTHRTGDYPTSAASNLRIGVGDAI